MEKLLTKIFSDCTECQMLRIGIFMILLCGAISLVDKIVVLGSFPAYLQLLEIMLFFGGWLFIVLWFVKRYVTSE